MASFRCCTPVMTHGGNPVTVLPGEMEMLALMTPPITHVKAVPAMMPLRPADFRSTSGGVGGKAVTLTVALPKIAPLVARTVFVNVPENGPAVKSRVLRWMVPPPFPTAQIGAMGMMLPAASRPTAANCCVELVSMVVGLGVTVIVARTGAAAVTLTVADPKTAPLVARTVFGNAPA